MHDVVDLRDVVEVAVYDVREVHVLHSRAVHRRDAASCFDEPCARQETALNPDVSQALMQAIVSLHGARAPLLPR